MRNISLVDYAPFAGEDVLSEIRRLGDKLKGLKVLHINSTAAGGGVAEILHSLVPLMCSAGLEARWSVIRGPEEFFKFTKSIHNGLHGRPAEISEENKEIYLRTAAENAQMVKEGADFTVIHDQQPLGLTFYRAGTGRWIWYCHVDPRFSVPEVWDFLAPMIGRCDLAVFHLPGYAADLPVLQYFMPPAIDPLADKNREVTPEEYRRVLDELGLDPGGPPVILQVSRFDRLKDPLGVIRAFRLVRQKFDCRLVLAGGGADDDPEGSAVLEEVRREAGGDKDITVLPLYPDADLEINVLQRRADVIVQKSLREGFGLTVTEALWKGKPVVATPTGGLAVQVVHGVTGLAGRTDAEVASHIEKLLSDPELAQKLGEAGRKLVEKRFILPVYLLNWLKMLSLLAGL